MRLPSFKRFFSQDFDKQYKNLIDKLSLTLNYGIEVLYDALNNNVTLRDNIKCTVKDVTLSVDAGGFPKISTIFTLDQTNSKVEGCEVINALNQTNSSIYPTSGVMINWTQNVNAVTINHVTGLQANDTYLLRIIAWLS